MAANLPVAFAALLAGGLLVDKGLQATKQAFSSTGTSSSTSPSSPGSTGGSLPVGASAKQIRDWLVSRGYTKVAAAGIVGNLQQESSLNPNAPGGGLAQWIGSRWAALVAFVTGLGLSPSSAQGQLEFLIHEIQTGYPGLQAQLNAASTPGEAATIFSNVYERPDTPMLQNRIAYANAAYNL